MSGSRDTALVLGERATAKTFLTYSSLADEFILQVINDVVCYSCPINLTECGSFTVFLVKRLADTEETSGEKIRSFDR